jgi:hypothetical protein
VAGIFDVEGRALIVEDIQNALRCLPGIVIASGVRVGEDVEIVVIEPPVVGGKPVVDPEADRCAVQMRGGG